MKATNDVAFKKVFQNKSIVKEFINNSLEEPVVDEVIDVKTDPYCLTDQAVNMGCVVADIYCQSSNKEEFIIQIQLSSHTAIMNRVVFYASRTICEEVEKQDSLYRSKTGTSKPFQFYVIVVVCDFNLLPNCSWYSHHKLMNVTELEKNIGQPLTEEIISSELESDLGKYEYVVLQLSKFNEISPRDLSGTQLWMFYFKKADNLTDEECLIIREKNPIVADAIEALRRRNFSDEELREYKASEDTQRSDIILSVGDEEFRAHKAILAERSPVFAAMFKHKMKEQIQDRIVITDIQQEVIREVLTFIYTYESPNIHSMAEELLFAADKYDLGKLKIMCLNILYSKLTPENAVNILILSDLHSANHLKTEIINFIGTCIADIKETHSWKNDMMKYPELVAEIISKLS